VTVRILVVDNFDSFVHNLVQYLAELGAFCELRRNDDPALTGPDALAGVHGVLISPGPGGPADAGASVAMVRACAAARMPLLGVCLGHQAVAAAYGGMVGAGPPLLHGTTSAVHHGGVGVLAGLPSPFAAARYNSLSVGESSLPPALQVTARTAEGEVMALRHHALPIEGVQFHPEAVLSEHGHRLLANWLSACGAPVDHARAATLDSRYAAVRSAANFSD
jgi:para-aminobenzoate synthetase component II